MDLPIVLSHKTAWLYHNAARPLEPLSRQAAYTTKAHLLARWSRLRASPNWGSMPRD